MDTELFIPKVNPSKIKKKRQKSIYRQQKENVHSTINGKGIVSRIK